MYEQYYRCKMFSLYCLFKSVAIVIGKRRKIYFNFQAHYILNTELKKGQQ